MESKARMSRKSAQPLKEVVRQYLSSMKLAPGMNSHLIFSAWNKASGADKFTVKQFYRDGKLYVTLNSSVVRSQLYFQKDVLLEKINKIIEEDELFISAGPGPYVFELILK